MNLEKHWESRMSDYKGTLEQGDLDWIEGVVNDHDQLDNMLSVGRAQRILYTIAALESENIALSERIGENQRLKNRGIEELNWRLGRAEAKLERVEDLVPPDHPARTQTQRVGNTIFDEILKALGEQQ